jgi:hypothetical protein
VYNEVATGHLILVGISGVGTLALIARRSYVAAQRRVGGIMSATLLEATVAIVLIVVAWQIGVIIAPSIMRWLRGLGREIDSAADQALSAESDTSQPVQNKKEHHNGTHR